MKNFISVDNVPDVDALIKKAITYKRSPFIDAELGKNKTVGLLFFNPSLRTRISTQVAARNLGMEAIVFNVDKDGWALEFAEGAVMNGSTVEHIRDAAPVLSAYFNILCIRSFPALKNRDDDYSEIVINAFLKYCGVPVVSLESATLHPLQSLADLVTIQEVLEQSVTSSPPKVVLTWAPHVKPLPQCVANSFSQWITRWGRTDFTIVHPRGYELDPAFTKAASLAYNQDEALAGADFVYVKNWSSFTDYGAMPGNHGDWMLTNKKLSLTDAARVMHCLPARRNVELSDEVLDSEHSLVTVQATNRVCAAQAVLSELLVNL